MEKASSIAAAAATASSSTDAAAAAAGDSSSTGDLKRQPATRPGSLPMPYRNGPSSSASSGDIADAASSSAEAAAAAAAGGGGPLSLTSFPTPMEEPRKAIKVRTVRTPVRENLNFKGFDGHITVFCTGDLKRL